MSVQPGTLEDVIEPVDVTVGERRIEGRSLGQIAWARLRKDRVAMAGGIVALILILIALAAWPLEKFGWIHPNQSNTSALNPENSMPDGPLGGASFAHPLGVEPLNGRDIMDRLIVGLQVSLFIAGAATVLAVGLGVLGGIAAGYFRGWVDSFLSRLMDITLAFPIVLFSIALLVIIRQVDNLGPLSGNSLSVAGMIFVIGVFGWAYPARIMRGQVISLREREFVEAARSLGARSSRVLFKELLPNLVAPILVYATLLFPTNILTEAGLSYLGVGIAPPTASLGQMISAASGISRLDPLYLIAPGLLIFIAVLSINLFGDGLRDAVDPKSSR
jgi:ABC-type dipeptide/oligopeptide/nickel transport system permease subunit